MRLCSSFWGGAASLVVPMTPDGGISDDIATFRAIHEVDLCWLHETLDERQRRAAADHFPSRAVLTAAFDENEVHPLALARPTSPFGVRLPTAPTERERRLALACVGYIPSADEPYWREIYGTPGEWFGDGFLAPLVHYQTASEATSPLRLTEAGYRVVTQANDFDYPVLYVIDQVDSDTIVAFWNVRCFCHDH